MSIQRRFAVHAACWILLVVKAWGYSAPACRRRTQPWRTHSDSYTRFQAAASNPDNNDELDNNAVSRKEKPFVENDDDSGDDELEDFEIEDLFNVFLGLDDSDDDTQESDDDGNDEVDLDELLRALENDVFQSQELQDIISKVAALENDEGSDVFKMNQPISAAAAEILEKALLQGVVPVGVNVGSDKIPGDLGFDPLNFSERDWIPPVRKFLLNLLPGPRYPFDDNGAGAKKNMPLSFEQYPRPKALIIRDYREAEIRHGRLAMLAAVIWPLQELLDELILPGDLFGPLIYGPVTLPYFPIFMTAILLLLGYLDIYSQSIKEMDNIGEAFLPGDCFWDPLRILQGAPDSMKRNMQEREIWNARGAMMAVAAYTLEEAITHKPLVYIGSNALLLKPAYQVPFIQQWLDQQFSATVTDHSAIPSSQTMEFISDVLMIVPFQ